MAPPFWRAGISSPVATSGGKVYSVVERGTLLVAAPAEVMAMLPRAWRAHTAKSRALSVSPGRKRSSRANRRGSAGRGGAGTCGRRRLLSRWGSRVRLLAQFFDQLACQRMVRVQIRHNQRRMRAPPLDGPLPRIPAQGDAPIAASVGTGTTRPNRRDAAREGSGPTGLAVCLPG